MEDFVNRRDFIRTFSILAGSSLVLSKMPWLKSLNAQENTKIVKLGILGMGSRGKHLHLFLKDIPNLDICCFCDDYQPHYEESQQLLGPQARGYYDYREMLDKEDLDALVIATPLHEHAHQTIDALNAGVHVLCEKAMAMTYEDCNEMVKAHLNTGKILYIGHQRLFDIKYHQAFKMMEEGQLGPITQIRAFWHRNNDWRRHVPSPELERKINWRLYNEYSLGLMTELACHHLQVANQIYDQHPECVWGTGSINHWKDGREVYDNVNLVYKYPHGSHLIYDSLISNKHYGLEVQVQGPKGTMELEKGKMWEEFPPPAPGILSLINHLERQLFEAVPIGGASWVPETAQSMKGKWIMDKVLDDDGTKMQMEAFVEDVRNNRVEPFYTKQGFYSSIATIMGHESMVNNEITYWPEGLAM
jgi:predicted dehydrogenase